MTNMTNFNFGYRVSESFAPDSRDDRGFLTVFTYNRCELSDATEVWTVEECAQFWAELSGDEDRWLAVFGEGREELEFSA